MQTAYVLDWIRNPMYCVTANIDTASAISEAAEILRKREFVQHKVAAESPDTVWMMLNHGSYNAIPFDGRSISVGDIIDTGDKVLMACVVGWTDVTPQLRPVLQQIQGAYNDQ
jgi:hypothetical protein